MTILARRKLSYHIVQTYLPSVFYILITWLCFLVPPHMVEARIGTSMTTLLTLTAMFASVRESTPTVSYVKAIDIWMVACIFFVFLTLLEFVVLVWFRHRRQETAERKLEDDRKLQDLQLQQEERKLRGGSIPITRNNQLESIPLGKYETLAEIIEKYALTIFAMLFLFFNMIYWSWLFCASDYYNWKVNLNLNKKIG